MFNIWTNEEYRRIKIRLANRIIKNQAQDKRVDAIEIITFIIVLLICIGLPILYFILFTNQGMMIDLS